MPAKLMNEVLLLAERDPKSAVRGTAIDKIGGWKPKDGEAVVRQALGDSSYYVAGRALVALSKYNQPDALALAKKWENETSGEITNAVAEVYVRDGNVAYLSWFEKRLDNAKGGAQIGALYSYANFLTKMEMPVALSGIENIRVRALNYRGGVYSHYAAGPLKRIGSTFKNKSDMLLKTMKAEKDKSKLPALQDKLADYSEIINAVNAAVQSVEQKGEE